MGWLLMNQNKIQNKITIIIDEEKLELRIFGQKKLSFPFQYVLSR